MCPSAAAFRMYCIQVMILFLWTAIGPAHVDSASISRRNVNGDSFRPEMISNNTTHPIVNTDCPVYQDNIKNTKPPFAGSLLRIHNATYGRLSLTWYTSAHFVWRVICSGEATAVLLMRLNISSGDYLQVKHRQLQGCTADYKGFVFWKRSILIGYVPDTGTEGGEFELGYVCFDRGSLAEKLAPEIFYNEEVLEYFQQHNGTFEKVAHLLRNPAEIINITDSDLRHILNIIQPPPPVMERENSTDSTTGSSANESTS